jgi:hypothetical protein
MRFYRKNVKMARNYGREGTHKYYTLATHEKMHCNCEIVWLRIGRAAVH